MNSKYIAEYKHVRIRPLEETDIELLREWRNDKNISSFLNPIDEITPDMQREWYYQYLQDSTIIQFAIEEKQDLNRVVGSVALYGFDGDRAEVGKIVVGDPEAKGKKIGFYGLILAMYLGFEKLGINTYIGDVHEDNIPAKTNDLRAGFVVTGKHEFISGGYELELELTKSRFKETHDFLDKVVIYQRCDDELYVGKSGSFSKTLTQSDAYNFAGICGDFNPIHINTNQANKMIFGKQVCHGMLTASLISTVIGTIMPGPGSIYLSQDIKFVRPVFFGDTITAIVTIINIDHNKGILTLKTKEYNQNNELVVDGQAKVKMKG